MNWWRGKLFVGLVGANILMWWLLTLTTITVVPVWVFALLTFPTLLFALGFIWEAARDG